MQMIQAQLKFRVHGDLERRIKEFQERAGSTLSESIRELVERGLLYSDTQTYDLAKSVSQLAQSYDALHERTASIESDLAQLVDQLPILKDHLDALTDLSGAAEDRHPTILKTLAELVILSRLMASDKPPEKLRQVAIAIDDHTDSLKSQIASETLRRDQATATFVRKERRK